MAELVRVREEQLPVLLQWLQGHLPESFKMYGTLRDELDGKWGGTTYYALVSKEWPNILAVAEGEVDPLKCPCPDYYTNPRTSCAYAPDTKSALTLLNWPGLYDWEKPCVFQACCDTVCDVLEEISPRNGGGCRLSNVTLLAQPGDVKPMPVPPDLVEAPMNPDLHADYAASTWPHRRPYAEQVIEEYMRRFPSVGLFKRDGTCVGFELGNDQGGVGLLYVEPEYRNRGLGKTITSLLAQKFFAEGHPVAAYVIRKNDASVRLHEKLGFKGVCHANFYHHYEHNPDDYKNKINLPTFD